MKTLDHLSSVSAPPATDASDVLVRVDHYAFPKGWSNAAEAAARARQCCEQLESERVLYFDRLPYEFPKEDQEFLLSQRQSGSRLHKNVSYRPSRDALRGAAGGAKERARLHEIMRKYSQEVTRFLKQLLSPYAKEMALDYASYRPEEEKGRDLPLHKRNDLLHCDAFPTRPMNGHRILRCFTNINPTAARIWNTTDGFSVLAEKYAGAAGLAEFAAKGSARSHVLVRGVKRAFGFKAVDHSAYDRFMLRFHDFLKENSDFQKNCPKVRLEYPPGCTWICYTDSVPHAVLSGRYALEQTVIIPLTSMVTPAKAPIRVLERLAGKPLSRAA
jgi:3-deoxy-D-manno-oct-2-ulosonic acid (Kdo) hydroxylase